MNGRYFYTQKIHRSARFYVNLQHISDRTLFFLPIINPEATKGSLSFFMMGVLLALVTIPSWTLNRGAFFHITEDIIRAKYHWFGKINCKLSDVTFVFPQINTLTICLKRISHPRIEH